MIKTLINTAHAEYILAISRFNKKIEAKLLKGHHKSVSMSKMSHHLHNYDYQNVLPQSTDILPLEEKERRVQSDRKHRNFITREQLTS